MSRNFEWTQRQNATPNARKEFERERLVAWTFELISEAMENSGRSKADLARALETSRANITQLLSGARNATLRTISDLAWACDSRLVLSLEPLREGEYIDAPVRLVSQARPRFVISSEEPTENECTVELDPLAA